MSTAKQSTSGSGWFSKLIVLLLLALAIALYLRIVMGEGTGRLAATVPQAGVRVVESRPVQRVDTTAALRELPADQMEIVKQVFAPELTR